MKIWIDQASCQNSGLCEEEAPELFTIGADFLAYVKSDGKPLDNPGGQAGQADLRDDLVPLAEQVAVACPASCIHLVD
jgi:ferredoxin